MFEISPTPFDVNLVAFRIPIRVHWSFWLTMILLGWNPDRLDLVFIWVLCGFFSILIHELGHALVAEWFNWPTHIVMYFFGGVAISERHYNNTPWRSIAVSLMGPGAGFLLLIAVVIVDVTLAMNRISVGPYFAHVLNTLIFLNFFYSLFNLIPVLPLDGGHVIASLCQIAMFRDALGITLKTGAVVSGVAAYYFFMIAKEQYAGIMMLMLCMQNVSSLQSRR